MNRERLTILRDHLASLPDERVRMENYFTAGDERVRPHPKQEIGCGTAACIAGWASILFADGTEFGANQATDLLDLKYRQSDELFTPYGYARPGRYTRSDAIAAIQSMLDSPDDDALPVWPEAGQ